MINMNYIKTLSPEVKSSKITEKNTSSTEKNDKAFKDVLVVKNSEKANEGKSSENKLEDIKKIDTSGDNSNDKETKELVQGIVEKLESLVEKLDNGTEEDSISDEILQLLALLNVDTSEIKALPMTLNLEELLNSISINNLNTNDLELPTLKLQDASLKLTNEENTIEDFGKLIEKLLSGENTVIDSTDVEELQKQLSKILALIKSETGKDTSKDKLIDDIKSKLEDIIQGNSSEANNKSEEIKVVTKDIVSNFKAKEPLKENVEVDNKKIHSSVEVSEEDKILNKLLGEDTKGFQSLINKFEAKNSIINTNATSGTPVFKETMDKDIIKNVKFMMRNAVQELKVKIYPKELGELTIKILSEEGIMRAEIKATSKETYNLLNSNMNEIKKALSNENIKIQEVNIGLYGEDTTYFSGQGFDGRAKDNREQLSSSTMVKSDEGEEIIEEVNNDSNVDLLA